MKKLIPAIIAIVLIFAVVAASLGITFVKKYSYSKEQMDLKEYYNIQSDGEAAIILQDEQIESKVRLWEGKCYMDFASIQQYLNDRFYVDTAENLLLFTTPTEIIRTEIGSKDYTVSNQQNTEDYIIARYEGDTLYVALDYVKQYTNFSYELFTEPKRIQLTTEWTEQTLADIKKDTAVRYQGGVKSPILRNLEKGETVTILEEMENWSKIKTSDALIGYVENKRLENNRKEAEVPVTDYVEPEYTSIKKDFTINLAWHQVMSSDANSTLQDVLQNTQAVNVVSPTWYSLTDNEGNFSCLATQNYVDTAHEMGLEVWALIDNFSDQIDTYTILSRTSSRTNLIQNLVASVQQYGMDGINIDFEQLSTEAGEPFTEFLRELSIQCRSAGIVLSVDNYVPEEYSAHYNRKEQGIVADYVIIMGYDEHWGNGGVAGSVASIGFVEEGIQKTVEEVPAEKIINAVPFYTRVWMTKGADVTSEALGMAAADEFISSNGIETRWDETTCQNYGEIQKGDTLYQVWMEDEKSIETKLTIMKKYNLAGVAGWKLSLDKPEIWNVIAAYVNS